MFTGSGMPMRFADRNGSPINIYQATTQMTDESGQSYPGTIDALLANALGPKGYYGVFTANMHTDDPVSTDGEAIINAALANGVPVVSAKQMLTWLDGRNESSFGSISWSAGKLQFNISPGVGATGLRAMVPKLSASGELESVKRGTTTVPLTFQTIKGVDYAFFDAAAGSYTATYSIPSTPAPSLTATIPPSPANNNSPKVTGAASAGSTVKIYAGSSCAGSPVATGTAAQLASGISVSVADDSTTTFTATATSGEATSSCSTPITYVEDTTAPNTTITQNPAALVASGAAEFKFSGDDGTGSGVASFQCRLDSSEAAAWASLLLAEELLGARRRRPLLRSPRDRPGRQHRRDAGVLHLDRRHHRAEHDDHPEPGRSGRLRRRRIQIQRRRRDRLRRRLVPVPPRLERSGGLG